MKKFLDSNLELNIKNSKAQFLRKYPNADLSKFEFVSYTNTKGHNLDINSSTFKNDKYLTKYIYINRPKSKFPNIWLSGGKIEKLPKWCTFMCLELSH